MKNSFHKKTRDNERIENSVNLLELPVSFNLLFPKSCKKENITFLLCCVMYCAIRNSGTCFIPLFLGKHNVLIRV